MDNYNENEFSIGNIMTLTVSRNDFDTLGSVIEMKFTHLLPNNHIIIMSFYNEENIQIHQKSLLLLCNIENILFDNVLILSNLNSNKKIILDDYKIKFLNKEIKYMKLYLESNVNILNNNNKNKKENFYNHIFDLKNLKILNSNEIKELSLKNLNDNFSNNLNNKNKEKNNLNLILNEIENVNKTLTKEKENIDIEKIKLKEKENSLNNLKEKINKKVVQFKEEIILFGDKCYGECMNEINLKMNEIQKKINSVENNVMNKYRIIKEKFNNNNNNDVNINNKEFKENKKEKIANLEIKVKFLEDSNLNLKNKLNEKEDKIKNYEINEEKLNKNIKKLKDENVLLNSQIKLIKKKNKNLTTNSTTNNNITINSISNTLNNTKINNESNFSTSMNNNNNNEKNNKKNKKLIQFEIGKIQMENFSKLYINDTLFIDNLSEKEIQTISLLIMHLSINPINLFNKYEYSHFIILSKILKLIDNGLYLNSILNYLCEFYNKFPEFKSNIKNFLSNNENYNLNKNNNNKFSLINLLLNNEINLSLIITNKCLSFDNFLKKYLNNKINSNSYFNLNIIKIILTSNLILIMLFSNECETINNCLKTINEKYFYENDNIIIKFLINLNYFEILLKIFNNLPSDKNYFYIENYIDSLIILLSNNENKNIILNNINLLNLILNNFKISEYIKSIFNDFINFFKENNYNFFENEEENKNKYLPLIKCIIFLTNLSINLPEIKNRIKEIFNKNLQELTKILNLNKKKKENLLYKNIEILENLFK